MYIISGSGFKATAKLIKLINKQLELGLTQIPSSNSIRNWVKKSGYNIYTESFLKETQDDYALIIDESMMIGSEKMLLTLGIKANKEDEKALGYSDVEILDISVKSSWNSSKISTVLSDIESDIGKSPSYVISDNAGTIKKALRLQNYNHVRDVGHTIAMLVERQFKKDESYIEFITALSRVRLQEIMKSTSYLLPPKQRSIARFMNFAPYVRWSINIQNQFSLLNENEKKVFGFIKNHNIITSQLVEIDGITSDLFNELKNKGLSKSSLRYCRKKVNKLFCSTHDSVVSVAKELLNYLSEEESKLPNEKTIWHCSSDIIESIFGTYKNRKSSNPLNGITSYVMMLPLLTKVDIETCDSNINFKDSLEKVFLRDITQWSDDNLTENMTIKRRRILKAA